MTEWNGRRRLARGFFQWLLVLWAAALVFYFEAREGLIRWPWLFESTDGGGFFQSKGWPDPRMQRPPAADAPVAPYVEIFKNLFAPWDVQWSNIPLAALLISAAMIGGYILIGWLLLARARVFVPRLAKLCIALVVGTGTVGICGELLGIADHLNRPWVAGMWAALLLIGGLCWFTAFLRRNCLQDFSAHTRMTAREQTDLARHWYDLAHPWPESPAARTVVGIYVLLFALITFFVTLHAIGEPVAYWDSLILYVGYARSMYLEGGFPEKVVGQVGLGLGANYPHLFEVLAAQTAALSGFWSDTFAQLLPPVATAAAMVLVYYAVTELTRERLVGLATAVIVRAVPYGLSYSQFASNYSLAILFTAAFLYLAIKWVRDGLVGYWILMTLVAAGAVHINYLMWGLWPVGALAIWVGTWNRPVTELESHSHERPRHSDQQHGASFDETPVGEPNLLDPPEPIARVVRPTLWRLLATKHFWLTIIAALVIAAPWYVRNVIVTGNPVYAFYANIFPSKHVNPDVMKSAEQEWLLNGDGLGRVGNTLSEKLSNSWIYFVTGNQHWKLAPFFIGFVLPGFVTWLTWWILRAMRRNRTRALATPQVSFFRAQLAPAALFLLLWFYAYVIADFYLYQIIIILPLFGIFAGNTFMLSRGRAPRIILHTLVMIIAIAPGLAMAIMGFKLKKTGVYEGMPSPQMNVTAIRKLFMNPGVYYRMEFGGDMEMINRVNMLPENTTVLTHENRTLLLDPTLKIINLDDWEVQKAYDKPATERIRILDSLSIKWYLYVPNETRHVANSWLGMQELIRNGYYEKEYETPSVDGGAAMNDSADSTILSPGKNILFKRTTKQP